MKAKYVGWRFWVEAGFALLNGVMAVITVLWSDWLEIVFRLDPDHRSGALEWSIVVTTFALGAPLLGLARREWRRVTAPA